MHRVNFYGVSPFRLVAGGLFFTAGAAKQIERLIGFLLDGHGQDVVE